MQAVSGQEISKKLISKLKKRVPIDKKLVVVQVGTYPISLNFIKEKENVAKSLGLSFRVMNFASDIPEDELISEVSSLGASNDVGGIVIQLPLPEKINKHMVLTAVPEEKDVDVLGRDALGMFYVGKSKVLPPAIGVVEELAKLYKIDWQHSIVAVVGFGFLIGRPVATWLLGVAKEVIVIDSKRDIKDIKDADVVISGVGKAGIIMPEMLKPGASVIDFGYSFHNGKMLGDFSPPKLKTKNLELKTNFYTPTPGGTGPILVSKLFENFYKLNENS
ncbi:MAG: bifunctional 5,10-methylenetetrahydrofolate dehydrogenase/5,10-methenyltetrahydrofolate cyclohydrolase [Candidatus Colwellbacteria bacterium]|nr:bifunctional 5,10-methylenetetrahydrofolate dehydrogenase/5,10-methenyltetrahydrofolate cyclohydrolase [Candidatus Colwellbacteria bacterium]